jgi:hypothetical protein
MNTAAKILTGNNDGPQFHALQIIFVRMLCTTILGSLYMWFNRVPDFPLGQHGIRRLLVLRGTAGFIGLFGLYCKSFSYYIVYILTTQTPSPGSTSPTQQ